MNNFCIHAASSALGWASDISVTSADQVYRCRAWLPTGCPSQSGWSPNTNEWVDDPDSPTEANCPARQAYLNTWCGVSDILVGWQNNVNGHCQVRLPYGCPNHAATGNTWTNYADNVWIEDFAWAGLTQIESYNGPASTRRRLQEDDGLALNKTRLDRQLASTDAYGFTSYGWGAGGYLASTSTEYQGLLPFAPFTDDALYQGLTTTVCSAITDPCECCSSVHMAGCGDVVGDIGSGCYHNRCLWSLDFSDGNMKCRHEIGAGLSWAGNGLPMWFGTGSCAYGASNACNPKARVKYGPSYISEGLCAARAEVFNSYCGTQDAQTRWSTDGHACTADSQCASQLCSGNVCVDAA